MEIDKLERKNNRNCTVVVSSCDKCSDLWYPFFLLFQKAWPENEFPIVLNTESKTYQHQGMNIETFCLYKENENVPWGKRLKETLKKIDTEYIILLLDDFFLRDRVNHNQIQQCIEWMEQDKSISSFCFMESNSKNIQDCRYNGFERRPLFGDYKFNCQATVWRRKRLIGYLRNNEDPWQWERFGNWRSYRYLLHKFYALAAGQEYVFPYIHKINGWAWGGLAIYRGKWYLPCVEKLFTENEIYVDFTIRGTVDETAFMPKPLPPKESYEGWKRRLFFIRPLYGKIYNAITIIKNIGHLF